MLKSTLIVATVFLILPSVSFAAYGAKNLDLKLFCVPLNTETESDRKQIGPFPISLVFKGKRAYENKIELNNKNTLTSKSGKSYSYTVYVDKIALKQKGGNQRLSLDKNTLTLKGTENFNEMKCESKSDSELKEEFNKILSQSN